MYQHFICSFLSLHFPLQLTDSTLYSVVFAAAADNDDDQVLMALNMNITHL